MSDMSARIAKAFTNKGYTYGDLSEITGISKSALQRYVTGVTEKIPIPRLESIAHALDTTPQYLTGWTDDPYDYDNDPNGLLSEIPGNAYRELVKLHPDDPEGVWHAWQAIVNDHDTEPPTYDITPPEYEMVCAYRVADDDTKSIVDTALKRYKKPPASEDAGDDASTYQAAARSGDRVDVNRVSLEEELAALPPKRKRDI